jgi:hypothetical protein
MRNFNNFNIGAFRCILVPSGALQGCDLPALHYENGLGFHPLGHFAFSEILKPVSTGAKSLSWVMFVVRRAQSQGRRVLLLGSAFSHLLA